MIITRTPFRVSFFGGGTDYQAWYSQHGGLVIGTTFERYCYISCRRLPPFFDYKTRLVYSRTEHINHIEEIQHPAIRGCLQFLQIHDGLEIHHDGDLPAGSGIGSSSAFTVGFLLSLHTFRHESLTKHELADQAIKVEQDVLREHVGIQDQTLAAYGGLQAICIEQDGRYEVVPLILPIDYMQALEQHVLLGFTGISRHASDLAAAQIERIQSGNSAMNEVHSLAKEALELFHQKADFAKIGSLLNTNWQIKRSLADGMSNEKIDQIYEAGRKAGAYGGKLLGAGGGGFMMFLAPPECHQRIKDALPNLKVWVPFKLDRSGAQVMLHTEENKEDGQ